MAAAMVFLIDIIMRASMQLVGGHAWSETIAERAVGVVVTVLLYVSTPVWAAWADAFIDADQVPRISQRVAFVLVALGMIAVTIVWAVAAWLVVAVTSGPAPLSAAHVLASAPPLLTGAALLAWSRHV